ncbi:MAG: nuclear transport factor 2 family protein [Cyclobacteriaceae bacterium]
MSNSTKTCLLSLLIVLACNKPSSEVSQEAQDSKDVMAIKEARQISNLAILNRDSVGVASVMMDNFQIITSRDNETIGKDANREAFIEIFKTDAVYTRTPDRVEVMEAWGMASEYGTWVGNLTVDNEAIEIDGTYYAKWHKIDGKWLLRTEVFTPIHCKGGNYCNNRPINP